MFFLRKSCKVLFILLLIYFFLLSIKLVGNGAKLLGEDFARNLISTTRNPVVALFIGVLVTAIVQSSSLTTSLVVALVGSGIMDLTCAIPIVMGANVGTTITNMIVSFGHISWRQEFKRAFAAATVHDIFNILTLLILFPLEMQFRCLTKLAMFFQNAFENIGGFKFTSPIKVALAPPLDLFENLFLKGFSLGEKAAGILLIIAGLLFLFGSLICLMKILRKLFIGKAEILIDRYIFRNGMLAMGIGLIITMVVQSSSLTTSIMVPLAGAGVLSLERVLPYTLGANVGTTFTALFASLAVSGELRAAALAVALAHLFFNISGILIFYPVKRMRMIPIFLAKRFAHKCSRRRYFPFIAVIFIFIVIPVIVIILRDFIGR